MTPRQQVIKGLEDILFKELWGNLKAAEVINAAIKLLDYKADARISIPDSVIAEYNNGEGVGRLAKCHGVSATTMRGHLLSKGVKLRGRGCPAGTVHKDGMVRKVPVDAIPRIVERRHRGDSLLSIANSYGVTPEAIRQIVKKEENRH